MGHVLSIPLHMKLDIKANFSPLVFELFVEFVVESDQDFGSSDLRVEREITGYGLK